MSFVRLFPGQFRCLSTANGSTIFAIASGRGKCAVSIFRVSGPRASDALYKICKFKILPEPRIATLRRFFDPESSELLDKGLVLWFSKPNSFTGEDSCELHVHGGLAVQSAIYKALAKIKHFRPAEAGEFTKRAFCNGKLDLTQVEGLSDVISAETEAQRKQAVLQMDGRLSERYESWSKRLLKCLAHIEAFIDFSEDENIEENVLNKVFQDVKELQFEINSHLNDDRRGERLRNGVRIAIIGRPNVGKSTLLNTLCKRPIAIVSSIPGTTRDVIEAAYDIGGYPVVFSDTAGLRNTRDLVECEGVKRAQMIAKQADLIIFVLDGTNISTFNNEYIEKSVCYLRQQFHIGNDKALHSLIAINKMDLIENCIRFDHLSLKIVPISCLTGLNLTEFVTMLKQMVEKTCSSCSDEMPLTNERHRRNLINSSNDLEQCVKMQKMDVVLAAENLRKAVRNLGKITGKVTPEDVLDVIFKEFCIGK